MSCDDDVTEIVNIKNKVQEAEKVTNVLQLLGVIHSSQKYYVKF